MPIENDHGQCFDARDCPHWHAATRRLNYVPAPYDERERMRQEARAIMSSDASLEDRVRAAERNFRALFDRSLEYAMKNQFEAEHPSFEEFVRMLDVGQFAKPDVATEIRRRYGSAIPGAIESGDAYWR